MVKQNNVVSIKKAKQKRDMGKLYEDMGADWETIEMLDDIYGMRSWDGRRFIKDDVDQKKVDFFRERVILEVLRAMLREEQVYGRPFYLWWPDNNINKYYLREGNPPADQDRPKHLRRLDLVVHIRCIYDIPESIRDMYKPGGLIDQTLKAKEEEVEKYQIVKPLTQMIETPKDMGEIVRYSK